MFYEINSAACALSAVFTVLHVNFVRGGRPFKGMKIPKQIRGEGSLIMKSLRSWSTVSVDGRIWVY
jgi:hypothetical protein